MEETVKQIARELKRIRVELEKMNDREEQLLEAQKLGQVKIRPEVSI